MVYDPATNEQLVETQAGIFRDINDYLLNLTAEELMDGKDYQGSIASWLQFKQDSFKTLNDLTEKKFMSASLDFDNTLKTTVDIAYTMGEQSAAAELLSAGIQPDLGAGFQDLAQYSMDALVDGIINRFHNRVNKLDITRSVKDAYSEATEAAAALVVQGIPLDQAVEQATESLLSQGIKHVNVGSRKMGIDAYAETSIRTIAGNAQVQGSIDRYEDAGQYLVWITDSPMECSLCRKWEGKILRTTNDLEKIPAKYHEYKTLEHAKSKGLFHPNCTHSAQMYIEGYSTPPKDTKDAENEKRRSKIRRLKKLERTNKTKAKFWAKNGSPRRAALSKKRAAKYEAERIRFESLVERKSLGWFTGEDRLRRLAAANGVPEKLINEAAGNLPQLNKIALKTGVDPRLVSRKVRTRVDKLRNPPDVRELGIKSLDDLADGGKELNMQYKRFFEDDAGIMNFLEDDGQFHQPPKLPEKATKSKSQFNKLVGNKKEFQNEYGKWVWSESKGKPEIAWSNAKKKEFDEIIESYLEEEIAGGVGREGKQIVAGGLPSSGKTFNLKNQGYDIDNYIIVNPDYMKTRIIINKYATKVDRKFNDDMTDIFINGGVKGAGSKLNKAHPVFNHLKSIHPDIAEDFVDKVFDKETLNDIREAIVAETNIGGTGLFGYEAANVIHEESSTLAKKLLEEASDEKFNIIQDVTMGTDKPLKAAEDLVKNKGYEKTEVMFVMFQKEQAVEAVVERYLRMNITNIDSSGRGGRYVMSGVLDKATVKVNAGEGLGKTIELLGREAVTDNELLLVDLLESDYVATDPDKINIINRYSVPDVKQKGFRSVRIAVEEVDGKFKAARQVRGGIDGLKEYTEDVVVKISNRAGIDDVEEMTKKVLIKNAAGEITGVNQKWLSQIEERKEVLRKVNKNVDDAGLYLIAKEKGFTSTPNKVKTYKEISGGRTPAEVLEEQTKYIGENLIDNEVLTEDVITYRGLSDSTDIDQEVWKMQTVKRPAAKRITQVTRQIGFDDLVGQGEFKAAFRVEQKMKRHLSDLGVMDLEIQIDGDSMLEAQKRFKEYAIENSDNPLFSRWGNPSFYPDDDILFNPELFEVEEFREIYDEILYERNIGFQNKKMPPTVMTGLEMHEEFIDGDYYAGHGVYGHGIYTDPDITLAVSYADQYDEVDGYGEGGVVQAMKVPAGTKMPSQETLHRVMKEVESDQSKVYSELMMGRYNQEKNDLYRHINSTLHTNIGRRLAAMGYQAYDVRMLDGIKGHIVILDRSIIEVVETPIYVNGSLKTEAVG